MREYLLGTLSDPEAEQLEHEYFADPACLTLLRQKEEELIIDYLESRLSAAEVALFEARYCSVPVLQEEVRRVRRARSSGASKTRWVWWPALAATAAVSIAVVSLWMHTRPQPEASPVASISKPSGGPILTLPLSPGLQRSADAGFEVSVPRNSTLELVLEIPGVRAARPYTVRILRLDGAQNAVTLWTSPVLTSRPSPTGSLLDVRLEEAVLSPDDYIAELLASDGVVAETYTYRITRAP